MSALSVSVVLGWLIAGNLLAQVGDLGGNIVLRGEIQALTPRALDGVAVELVPLGGAGASQHADVDPGGAFRLLRPQPGSYRARVWSPSGNLVHQEVVVHQKVVLIQDINSGLTIQLPSARTSAPIRGTVSAARLQHQSPSRAVKEFREGLAAMEQQDTSQALPHLHKALGMDPDSSPRTNCWASRI